MRPSSRVAGTALTLSLAALAAHAIDGIADTTFGFGTGHVQWTGGPTTFVEVADAVALNDGTLIGVGTSDASAAGTALHWQAFDRTGNLLNRACYLAPGTLFQSSIESHGLTALVDSTGGLLVGGWHKGAAAPTQERALLARFDAAEPGCVLDTTFNATLGWWVDLSTRCDTENCRIIDLAEIRPETGGVDQPLLVALLEQKTTSQLSRYYLVGLSTSASLQTAFGTSGYAEVTVGGLGFLVGNGSARIDVDGLGRIHAMVSRVDPGELGDTDPVVLRFTPGGDLDGSFGTGGVLNLDDEPGVNAIVDDVVCQGTPKCAYSGYFESVAQKSDIAFRYPRSDGQAAENIGLADFLSSALASEGTGRLIVVMNSDPSVSDKIDVWRRNSSDLNVDTTFNGTGKTSFDLDLGGANGQTVTRAILAGGKIVLAGTADVSATRTTGFLYLLQNAYVFADGFEWGTVASWSGQNGLVLP